MSIPAIDIQNITVRFQGKCIWENFSMQVNQREKVVLDGRSGIGKSTLFQCLMGFVAPETGTVLINGQALTPQSIWTLRTQLAYVPQEADLGSGQLCQWIKAPFAFKANCSIRNNLSRLPELFDRFLLSADLLDNDVSRLSGGEKQRVAIISAILLDRKIFLLDEPTSAMDRVAGKAVLDFFRSIPDNTILAVSHDGAVLDLADRVVTVS
jgi:ABC-type multidrug transport system ATPase subunit